MNQHMCVCAQTMAYGVIPFFLLGGALAFIRLKYFNSIALKFKSLKPDVKSR